MGFNFVRERDRKCDKKFCPYTRKFGSEKTHFFAYLTQCFYCKLQAITFLQSNWLNKSVIITYTGKYG